jgi:hypothetical protein
MLHGAAGTGHLEVLAGAAIPSRTVQAKPSVEVRKDSCKAEMILFSPLISLRARSLHVA